MLPPTILGSGLSLGLTLGLTLGLAAAPLVLHVAPDGRDDWSGRPVAPRRDGRDGPLATVSAALKAARLARQQPGAGADGVTLLLRGGTHELAGPITIGPEDSGASAEQPLTIAAYPNEAPVLSGGRAIRGWKRVADQPGLWQAEVPAQSGGPWIFRSLFADGRRLQRARTPNQGYYRIRGESPQDRPVKLRFKSGDLRKAWAEDGEVEVVAYLAWADLRMQIRSVDEVAGVALLSGDPQPSNRESDAQYYVENAADALDAPGEWYLDRRKGVVYCRARSADDLGRVSFMAPRLTELMTIRGDAKAGRPVRHVRLQGLTFACTDWTLGPEGYADTQAAFGIAGDVRAEGAVDCVVEGCRFEGLGGYGLELGRGCERWRVVGNEMVDLGAGGMRLGEPGVPSQAADACRGHEVTDNHLHRLGRVYAPAIGVLILQSGANHVAHNHIHDLFYTAISLGWNWGYQETPCRDNVIEFNHLHDIGQFRLSDMGAVYTLGIQKGTVIRNNLIHDVQAFTYGGWGLYTDEGSSEIVLENNVVYRTKSAGFHQHYGRDNLVRNNIFAYGREYQLMRSREEDHRSFIFERNVVYFDSGDLLGSNWSNDRFQLDRNLYFDARSGAAPESLRFRGATLEQWRARGHDRHSLVADPLFVAPREYDFRLQPNSPAHQLGFQPIDLANVGVRRPHRARVRDSD